MVGCIDTYLYYYNRRNNHETDLHILKQHCVKLIVARLKTSAVLTQSCGYWQYYVMTPTGALKENKRGVNSELWILAILRYDTYRGVKGK